MGELILCNQQIAALPYYIESASLNVYSLEELSYYIEHNLYLLTQDFMEEELCIWVAEELKLKETAEHLQEIRRENGTLSEFVLCILKANGFCTPQTILQIKKTLQEMENKTDFECGKIRADRYVENRRYLCGIYEYRKLLVGTMGQNPPKEDPLLLAAVWHNIGTAYARLFLFDKAAVCYANAYELSQKKDTLRQCLMAYRCAHDEKGYQRKSAACFLSEEEQNDISSELTRISRMEEIRQFEQMLDEMFDESIQKNTDQTIVSLIEEWKDEYRKNCRI